MRVSKDVRKGSGDKNVPAAYNDVPDLREDRVVCVCLPAVDHNAGVVDVHTAQGRLVKSFSANQPAPASKTDPRNKIKRLIEADNT